MSQIKKIAVICFANYCRSPVAEKILKFYYGNKFELSSYGFSPYPESNMDLRSQNYLKHLNHEDLRHYPKKITDRDIDSLDLVLAIDMKILAMLNKKYPKHRSKFKIFSYNQNNIDLSDPFKMPNEKYDVIMENINFLCKNFESRFEQLLK